MFFFNSNLPETWTASNNNSTRDVLSRPPAFRGSHFCIVRGGKAATLTAGYLELVCYSGSLVRVSLFELFKFSCYETTPWMHPFFFFRERQRTGGALENE